MENYSIYEDVLNRTGGDIYIGVVGPVRTGKSTFIKRFMETLVLPNAKEEGRAEMITELPQSAAGKTVMTTEPKFIPAKGARISVGKGAEATVRLVDCVGFAVEGASGFEEDGEPRLVHTPWKDTPIPFTEAAAIGTEKVIREHSTIGILVTTDGSITDIPRASYEDAEARSVEELKRIGKPFVILLNCKDCRKSVGLKNALESKYGVPVVALNVEKMGEEEVLSVLQKALFEFPVLRIDFKIPKWLQSFSEENCAVSSLLAKIKQATAKITKMRDCFALENLFLEDEDFSSPDGIYMDLGQGRAEVSLSASPSLFYRVLSEECGEKIEDDLALVRYTVALFKAKHTLEGVQEALRNAEENGYGIVYPSEGDYALEKPQLIKKNAGYGVRFKANAVSYHIVKVEVGGEISPIIGTKQQGEEFVADTLRVYEEGEEKVWETNIFGKSLRSLIGDEFAGKADGMPIELRKKLRRAVTRIVNDGKGNLICLVF